VLNRDFLEGGNSRRQPLWARLAGRKKNMPGGKTRKIEDFQGFPAKYFGFLNIFLAHSARILLTDGGC
jgi:hypothetical protein